MLFITAFKNYSEFQELFGVRVFDGKKARKNKILLSLLKDKVFFKESVKSGNLYPFSIKNMVNLRNYLVHRIHVRPSMAWQESVKMERLTLSATSIWNLEKFSR